MKVLLMNCSPVKDGATAEIINVVIPFLETKYDGSLYWASDDKDVKIYAYICKICINNFQDFCF